MKWNEVSLFVFTELETHFFKGQSKRQEQSQMALGDNDHIQLNTFLLVDGCSKGQVKVANAMEALFLCLPS